MRRLWLFAISILLIIGSHSFVYAEVTQADLAKLQSFTSTFNQINPTFGTRWSGMSNSVYDRFKNDPDMSPDQLRRYVLQGIPGATIPDQTGFIPMLNGIINGNANSDLASKAKIALSQANQLLSNNITREQLEGGSITQQQADEQINASARANATQTASELQKRSEKKCSLLSSSPIVDCIDIGISWFIKNTLLQIAGFLVWLCANMLNYAIQVSILDFAKWASSSLYPLWLVIRQIVSLVVVFAGLWLGFMYMIGREQMFSRYVGWLVMFALFVNFSYPLTRVLIDISNVISLNVYTSAVGPDAISTNFSTSATTLGANTPGSLIMNKLGLVGLIASATTVEGSNQTDLVKNINTTPGALIAVAFVLYAAYIFFRATTVIAIRTAVLVFLIIGSPILLIDSVVPKLGEVAMKMRKLFFEQLAVAPVFMVMLALTLRFMDIFQTSGGPLASDGTGIQMFFGILMMLIMLHITLKVTTGLAGEAGKFATNMMGKVGGFGLGVATAGTGFLARGTIGQLAAGARDSQWMDKVKASKMGRGLYGLSNSLAQSTYDARNIGVVSKGMATAGLTSIAGIGMQQGTKRTWDAEAKAREESVVKFGSNIRDDTTRKAYFNNANKGLVYSKVNEAKLAEADIEVKNKREAQISAFIGADKDKQDSLINQAKISGDYELEKRLTSGKDYLGINNRSANAAQQKAGLIKVMGLTDPENVKEFLKKDPFKDINKIYDDDIEKLQDEASKLDRSNNSQKIKFGELQAKIGNLTVQRKEELKKLREATLAYFQGNVPQPQAPSGPANPTPAPNPIAPGSGPTPTSTSNPPQATPTQPAAPSPNNSAAPQGTPPVISPAPAPLTAPTAQPITNQNTSPQTTTTSSTQQNPMGPYRLRRRLQQPAPVTT